MGEFQAMHKYFAIFLVLVACHGSISAHGRQAKPLNQHSSLKTNTQGHKHNPQPILAPLKTSINYNTQLKVESPIVPKYDVALSGDSGANDVNAFRPTTPGNSPGVGHRKFAAEEKGMKAVVVVHSPHVKVSVPEGFKNDFAPTGAGHSPGVGHPRQHKNGLYR